MASEQSSALVPMGWIAAVVAALWAALRAAGNRELAFVKGELKAEREAHERDRREDRAALERLGAKYDELLQRHERYCIQAATVANAAGDGYRESMPTGVRDLAELMAKSTPTPAPQRPRMPTIREEYAVGARPTVPAPAVKSPAAQPSPPRPSRGGKSAR